MQPGLEESIERAVFADGRLWLLTDSGQLSSVQENQDQRVEESLPQPTLELCRQDGAPVAITCDRESCSTWEIRRRSGVSWSTEASVPTNGDNLIAASCFPDRMTLLSSRRLVEVVGVGAGAGGKTRDVTLSEPLRGGLIAVIFEDDRQLLVGVNAGEWGGGLRRVDRSSGKVTKIERNDSGALCGGPLTTGCDPVNGIAAEPWRPGCVTAVIGMSHFGTHGRIVEVCGDQVNPLYSQALGKDGWHTVAFWGIARSGDGLWAAAMDGLYRIEKGQVADAIPLPAFRSAGNSSVSFAIPELVLLVTTINARASVSGPSLLVVPR